MAILYRTENKLNSMFYYGVHHTNEEDGYLGGGTHLKRSINKHGKENFVRRTIKEFETSKEAFELEALMVDDLLLKDPKCYNLAPGGLGGVGNMTPWNKGIKNPGVGGRKPGYISHRKGKSYDNPIEIFGVMVPSVRLASIESKIPSRTLFGWAHGCSNPNPKNKSKWEAYVSQINQ